MNQQQLQYPLFYYMMNDFDKYQYNCLKFHLSSGAKNQRNKRLSNFNGAIESIKNFAIRGDKDDKLRSLVAGICWLPEGIAINTHQLKALLGKCKSSINGSLQKMGFAQNLTRAESITALTNFFPFLRDNTSELRKWSIRHYPSFESSIYSPPLPHGEQQKQKCEQQAQVGIVVQGDKNALPKETGSSSIEPSDDIFEPAADLDEPEWPMDVNTFWE